MNALFVYYAKRIDVLGSITQISYYGSVQHFKRGRTAIQRHGYSGSLESMVMGFVHPGSIRFVLMCLWIFPSLVPAHSKR